MSRISQAFARLKAEERQAIIPFIMAGDPDLHATRELLVELARSGADLIEVGVPFSDPIADGPVIQRASLRALRNRVGVSQVLEAVCDARKAMNVPVILFSYFNPLLQFGAARLGEEARKSGVDGVLVTDLAPEGAGEFSPAMKENGLDCIQLAAPTSTDARLRVIAERAQGFIYAVSRAGVTGAKTDVSADAKVLVTRLREFTDLPVAVGFGISEAAQVAEVWRYADGAIVGSAIVAEIERHATASDMVSQIGKFMRNLLPPDESQ
ncbi:MAG: tryptophan synthase subunit alpha [Rubrivivax sp.]|nr:tryptophan synthase subunit alpha [Pyrinomonadaceae bacterium]